MKNVKFNPILAFDESIDTINESIESYRKLAPAVMPIIKQFADSIYDLYLTMDQFNIGFKDKTPKGFLLKCEELNLKVDLSCGSGLTFNYSSSSGPRYYLTLQESDTL